MHKLLLPIIVILTIIASTMSAIAQDKGENLVQIRLMAERGNVNAGEEIWIGMEQAITPHWHTYWKNPGDSGTITASNWTLPYGATISDIHWPTPKRLPFGPLMNFGYEDNVVLLQKLKLPNTLPEGPITLSADIELLVCKEECIPEYGTYILTLNGEQSENENNTAYFEAAIAKLPIVVDWSSNFQKQDAAFKLEIDAPNTLITDIQPETLSFFPLEWGLIENAAEQSIALNNSKIEFSQNFGERNINDLKKADFLVTFKNKQNLTNSFLVSANKTSTAPTAPNDTNSKKASTETATSSENIKEAQSGITVFQAIIYALLGGIVLNLMPCVFPVLSIKALSLIKISDESPALARMHGIAYTLGVVLSFLTIAGILLVLKSAGAQIGWGFQLQNPIVVGALAYLLFIVGLNLMGFFEFGGNLGNIGNKLTQGNGLNSSFFTGILATLVATPCTAPFMAAAIGFALTQGAFVNLSVFAALGLGLALPYLALSFAPALQKMMPKPGAWMNTFKELLAFPIFLSAVWLTWVVAKQSGSDGVLQILIGMSAITFGIWLLKKSSGKMVLKLIALMTLIIAAWIPTNLKTNQLVTQTNETKSEKATFGETFSLEKIDSLLNQTNDPVFVEMTAAWCITCKVNNKVAINIDSTKKVFANNNVRYLVGDWTNQDPKITQYLNKYGRNGVPIYVFYGEKDNQTGQRPEAQILPQILTPNSITNLFK
ncbi:MAG: protein-disulfide reductase DsbD family protein [Bdellovibrionales bacterium]